MSRNNNFKARYGFDRRGVIGSDLIGITDSEFWDPSDVSFTPISNVGHGEETGEPTTVEGPSGTYTCTASAWFDIFATYTGHMGFGVRDATFDFGLSVYTGPTVDDLTFVAGADPNDDLVFPCEAYTFYRVRIGGVDGDTGMYFPTVYQVNFFGGASDIGVNGTRHAGWQGGFTGLQLDKDKFIREREPGCPVPKAGYTKAVVWLRCTPVGSGSVTFSCPGAAIGVYTGNEVDDLTKVGAGVAKVTVELVAGTRYSIQLASTDVTGTYQLVWTELPKDPNNITITDGQLVVAGEFTYAWSQQPLGWLLNSPDGKTLYLGEQEDGFDVEKSGFIDDSGWHEVTPPVRWAYDFEDNKPIMITEAMRDEISEDSFTGIDPEDVWPVKIGPTYYAPSWYIYSWSGIYDLRGPNNVYAGIYVGTNYVEQDIDDMFYDAPRLPGPEGSQPAVGAGEAWFADSIPAWNADGYETVPFPNGEILGHYVANNNVYLLFRGTTSPEFGESPFPDGDDYDDYVDPTTGTSSVYRVRMPLTSTYNHRVRLSPELLWTGPRLAPFLSSHSGTDTSNEYVMFLNGLFQPEPPAFWGYRHGYHWLVLGIPVAGRALYGESRFYDADALLIIRDDDDGNRRTFQIEPGDSMWRDCPVFHGWWGHYMVFATAYGFGYPNADEPFKRDFRLFDALTMEWGPRLYFPGNFRLTAWVETRGDSVLATGYYLEGTGFEFSDDGQPFGTNPIEGTEGIYQLVAAQDIEGDFRLGRRWFR